MKSKQLSLIDALFVSLMVGAGETYLPAYALSVGITETSSGLLTSVPLVIGALIQLLTPWGVQKIGNIKKWVVLTASLQALAFIPLIYFSLNRVENPIWIFIIAGFYYGAGFAAAAPWNFWMTHLVSTSESLKYFSFRLYLSQIGTLVGLIGAGVALHNHWHLGPLTSAYSLIFFVAFLSRVSSSLVLHLKEYRLEWMQVRTANFKISDGINQFLKNSNYKKFFGFLFLFYVFIFFSSPFVSPFILKKLNFEYADFMWIIGSLLIGKMLGFLVLKKYFYKKPAKCIFLIGALGISPLPALWSHTHLFHQAVLLQIVSGFFWAMFESGLAQIFFSEIKKEEKISVITLFNLFYAAAVVIGSVAGATVLKSNEEAVETYHWVFSTGSILRITLVLIFCWMARRQQDLLES